MTETKPFTPYSQFQNNMGQAPQYPKVVVEKMPLEHTTEVVKWRWCHLVTSILAAIFCNVLGIPAMAMSLLAYNDHHNKEFVKSKSKIKVALGLGITGLVLGIILVLLVIGGYSFYFYMMTHSYDGDYEGNDMGPDMSSFSMLKP